MEEYGDIIYIVILVAISLIGSLKGKNNKLRKQKRKPQPQPSMMDERENGTKEMPTKPQPMVVTQSTQPQSIKPPKYKKQKAATVTLTQTQPITVSASAISNPSVAPTIKPSVSKKETDIPTHDTLHDFTDPSELRRAIIASEILTPKF